jgi:prepilin-type N-terminal cleavage/methylation domain-containing protein
MSGRTKTTSLAGSDFVNIARRTSGFTLIELIVVISILGLLAALAVPAIKNLGKSNITVSAARQLLDDIARARQLAITDRTTVYMIFVPTNFWDNLPPTPVSTNVPAIINLSDKQLTGYTFLSLRSVGDQPGRGTTNYLAGWQTLPQGDFIAQWKFQPRYETTYFQDLVDHRTYNIPGFSRTVANFIPFPSVNSAFAVTNLPYIAFNYLGQLTTEQLSPAPSQQDEYIPLAQGSVAPATDPITKAYSVGQVGTDPLHSPYVTETPPGNSTNASYNVIHIDWLTGRAREEVQLLR